MVNRSIFIYNLETNLDSRVLASAHDWVEHFSRNYSKVFVYSTHVGRLELPDHVTVMEIGGGTLQNRLFAFINLLRSLILLFKQRNSTDVFHHMSSRTLLLIGFPIKLMKVPQIIWYSHSVADIYFRLGARFAGRVVSATVQSVPNLRGIVIQPIGHGISLTRLGKIPKYNKQRQDLVAVGRVVSIKNIEDAIRAISHLSSKFRKKIQVLKLVGPYEEKSNYLKFLFQKSYEYDVKVTLLGPVAYNQIPSLFAKTSIVFSGTPKSVDKAVLEAAMMGCLILTTNESVQKLTGMDQILPSNAIASDLVQQLTWMLSLTGIEKQRIREVLASTSRKNNSLDGLVLKIIDIFNELRSNSTAHAKFLW